MKLKAIAGALPLVEHRSAFTGDLLNDGFSFQHLRLQEFLAACHVARSEASIGAVVGAIPDSQIGWWNAVLQLVVDLTTRRMRVDRVLCAGKRLDLMRACRVGTAASARHQRALATSESARYAGVRSRR